VFDARGFASVRPSETQFAFEHVDPLTGNLLLTFTDLVALFQKLNDAL
jgi:hypothetical protein